MKTFSYLSKFRNRGATGGGSRGSIFPRRAAMENAACDLDRPEDLAKLLKLS